MRRALDAPDESSEIARLIVRYTLLLDSGNKERVVGAIFTDDAVLDYEENKIVGTDAIRAFYASRPPGIGGVMHFVNNFSIDVDGDLATSLSYYQAWHWFVSAGRADSLSPVNFVSVGCFDDDLVRTREGWRIRQRALRPISLGPIGIGRPRDSAREMYRHRVNRPNLQTPGSPPRAAIPR